MRKGSVFEEVDARRSDYWDLLVVVWNWMGLVVGLEGRRHESGDAAPAAASSFECVSSSGDGERPDPRGIVKRKSNWRQFLRKATNKSFFIMIMLVLSPLFSRRVAACLLLHWLLAQGFWRGSSPTRSPHSNITSKNNAPLLNPNFRLHDVGLFHLPTVLLTDRFCYPFKIEILAIFPYFFLFFPSFFLFLYLLFFPFFSWKPMLII